MSKQTYNLSWIKQKISQGERLKYIYFWGHTNKSNEEVGKFIFSQWYECSFTVENIVYPTAEHWMMAQKALLFHDKNIFEKIINTTKPGEVKELGRQVSNFHEDTWVEKRYEIVVQGNFHKFSQNPKLKDYLLKTGGPILVEASPDDIIWGIGLSQDSKHIENIDEWRGENLLGFALMEVRDILR